MIYVYTSILNGWDNLRAPLCHVEPDPGVRWLCFTNVPNLPNVAPWEYRPIYGLAEACRAARVPKILPHLMLPSDAEYSIYHDGNFELQHTPRQMVADLLRGHDWAAHRHPCRKCIYREADILLRENIGTRSLVLEEIERYRLIDYPADAGLWANGLLVRRHTDAVKATCERWWKLYAMGCERDQLSFPVARKAENLQVRTIDADVWQSPYVAFSFHAAWKDKPNNRTFQAERDGIRASLSRLQELAGEGSGLRYTEY